MSIKKAILPVAGMGTRFLPITKALPKEMLPIIDKSVIHHIVEEAVNSGIDEIILVTGRGKGAIEDYFDRDPYLLETLGKKGKEEEVRILKDLENLAKIVYVRQPQALGDGHAILCAEQCISEGEDFAVLFGDDIIDGESPALSQLISAYNKTKSCIIGVQDVPGKAIENYGVVDFGKKELETYEEVIGMVEKPKYEDAPSQFGIIGKYVCTYDVLEGIKKGAPSNDGELRLIDGFRYLLEKGHKIYCQKIIGERYDTGSKIGWLKSNIAFALKDPELSDELRDWIKSID